VYQCRVSNLFGKRPVNLPAFYGSSCFYIAYFKLLGFSILSSFLSALPSPVFLAKILNLFIEFGTTVINNYHFLHETHYILSSLHHKNGEFIF
jgi:hypothetical protein